MKQLYFFFLLSCNFLLVSHTTFAQEGIIEGKVIDKITGDPLPFVNVVIQGTNSGTQADFDGVFQLNKAPNIYAIELMYLGYKVKVVDSILVKANETTFLGNIEMEEDVTILEVVEIKGERITDLEKKQPLTVESLSLIHI